MGGSREKLFRVIISHRTLVLLAMAALTVLGGYLATGIKFDNSIESYFLPSDLGRYHRFLDAFGTDEIVVVAFADDDIFTENNFRLIDSISRSLEELPQVRRVVSLTTVNLVQGRGDTVVFGALAEELPHNAAELERIKRLALADPIISRTLVSADAKKTAVVAEINHLIGQFDYKVELLGRVRALLDRLERSSGKHFSLGGTSVLDDALFRYTQKDQMHFFPLMGLILVVVMVAMFRRLTAALLPLLVVAISAVWTYGLMALLGYKINVISMILGPLLLAVGVADSMHILADYLQRLACAEHGKEEAVRRSFVDLILPCSLTSITTAFGLLSLLSADLLPIRQFGLIAAAGVLVALVVTIVLMPIALSLLPAGRISAKGNGGADVLDRALQGLGRWKARRSLSILLLCAVVSIPAAMELSRLTVGTNALDYFRDEDVVRLDTEWIDHAIAGTTSLEFVVEGGTGGTVREPALLRKMDRFQRYLLNVEGITTVYSLVDVVKTLNRAFHEGQQRAYRIPGSAAEISQELLLVEGSRDLSVLLDSGSTRARITARVEMNSSRRLAHEMPEIEARMHEIFGPDVQVSATGVVYLMNRMEHYLLSSQIDSFALAFVVITLTMVVALRSWKLGLLAMIPNVLPILFVVALMPLLGIALDVGTVMIAGVALGLVVDDTIHFLFHLGEELRRGADTRDGIARTMEATGRPIVFTSVVLSFGFSVLVFASFRPVIHFGLLASIVIALALLFDLVVLPAVVGFLRLRPRAPVP